MKAYILFLVWIIPFVTSQLSLPDDELHDTELHDGILQAMCTARCLQKHGTSEAKDNDDLYHHYAHPDCKKLSCRQCMVACNSTVLELEDCDVVCENKTSCKNSCFFFLSESEKVHNAKSHLPDTLSKPQVLCMNIPYSRHGDNVCRDNDASLTLKWSITKLAEYPVVFIVSVREMESEDDIPSKWHVLHVTSSAFVRIRHLSCGSKYQFKVTPVTTFGLIGQSNESNWITTPAGICSRKIDTAQWKEWIMCMKPFELKPPRNLRIIEQALHSHRPSAVIAWDEYEDSSCFYRVYWMSKGASEKEIKAPPAFKYRITGLQFSTNYTVRLYSYDEEFMKGSREDAATFLITPGCLQATDYNYTTCPPEAPDNVKLTILTENPKDRNVQYVNISLTWDAPAHTNNGKEILQYLIEWRKEPPIHAGHLIVPHREIMQINVTQHGPPSTSAILYNLHNHNLYSVMLAAKTSGGIGKVVSMMVSLGLPVANTTTASPQAYAQPVGSEQLNSSEILIVILIPTSLFLIVVIGVIFLARRRKLKSKPYVAPGRCGAMEELNPIYDGTVPYNISSEDWQPNEGADKYEIDFNCLTFTGVLGEGAFGKVIKAEFCERSSDKGQKMGRIVAVKMLRDVYSTDELRHFKLEIDAMKALGSHPYIVSIIGCCLYGPKMCLVMDYCALGDLRNYLRKYRETLMYNKVSPYNVLRGELPSDNSETPLVSSDSGISQESEDGIGGNHVSPEDISEAQLLSYARQVTMGMEYLEQRKFVHRDLAARNILLYDRRHVKISDFGLSRDVYETNMYQPTSARKLPYKWMALESLFSQEFTIKSDVWSFGIVLWEIVTLGGSPYPSVPLKDLYGLLNEGYRMEKPENCSPNIYQIMLTCWHPCPASRPSFSELRTQLEAILEETQSYIDLSIEVSGDYFHNDSTTGSQRTNNSRFKANANPKNSVDNDRMKEQCRVDIHDTEGDSDKGTISIESSCVLTSEPGDDEVFLDNESKHNFCLFNLDNSLKQKTLKSDALMNNDSKCECVLCINRDSLKSTQSNCSTVQPLKHKTSFRDSLRCIIEKVGKTNSLFLPLARKRSFSLTDMDKGGKCTIHL